jgi:hypothetical protein
VVVVGGLRLGNRKPYFGLKASSQPPRVGVRAEALRPPSTVTLVISLLTTGVRKSLWKKIQTFEYTPARYLRLFNRLQYSGLWELGGIFGIPALPLSQAPQFERFRRQTHWLVLTADLLRRWFRFRRMLSCGARECGTSRKFGLEVNTSMRVTRRINSSSHGAFGGAHLGDLQQQKLIQTSGQQMES